MIDIEKAKVFYKEYISNYNPEDPKIALKISHIYRTAEKAKKLATYLKLSQEDIQLAELIGMLHDIGRFEQIKKYDTFVDKDSVNHGEYGVKILFEENLIRKFIEDESYDNIIKKAILNHNRDKIENGLDDRTLMHCKIIRDADKLDIFYVLLTDKIKTLYSFNTYPKEHVSKKIKEDLVKIHKINYANIKTSADVVVSHIAYVFDINYTYTLKEIEKNNYINRLIDRYDAKEKDTIKDLNELKIIANEYIKEKLKEE